MFDLGEIEKDYHNSCVALSDKEIDLIYLNDRVMNISNSLSEEAQKEIISGSMDIVFTGVKGWNDFLNGRLDVEEIYYVCLESLIKSVKTYSVGLDSFKKYVEININTDMVNYLAQLTNYAAVDLPYCLEDDEPLVEEEVIPTKPSKIFYLTQGLPYYEDSYDKVYSNNFTIDYRKALSELPYIEGEVMRLSYDNTGNDGLTPSEIADYLCVDRQEVVNAKKRALTKLKNNDKMISYM